LKRVELITKVLLDFEYCVSEQPKNARIWFLKGCCSMQFGKYLEGIADMKKAIELDKTEDVIDAYYTIAISYYNLVDRAQAFVYLQKFVEKAPMVSKNMASSCYLLTQLVMAHGVLGDVHIKIVGKQYPEKVQQALYYYKKAIESEIMCRKWLPPSDRTFTEKEEATGLMRDLVKYNVIESIPVPMRYCCNPQCNKMEPENTRFPVCAKCKKVRYCCKECQAVHWKASHRDICKTLAIETSQ